MYRYRLLRKHGRKLTSKEAYIIITADATVDFKQGGTSKDQMIVIMP